MFLNIQPENENNRFETWAHDKFFKKSPSIIGTRRDFVREEGDLMFERQII